MQTLQRGMNFRLKPTYSVVLMSQRTNAPYRDQVLEDGQTIEYEGHDTARQSFGGLPKLEDQPRTLPSGRLTQNGYFSQAVDNYKTGEQDPELVKVYEKLFPGVWSLKGIFDLIDYRVVHDGHRSVFRFLLKLIADQEVNLEPGETSLSQTRIIPSEVKKEVWKRDGGKCVLCGSTENLHFDHDLPFSRGGTSLTARNIRLLCMRHNLEKSAKIQ